MLYFYHVLRTVESETVWRALSSQHRRKLLELLRDGPRTTGELSKSLPELTRFAVMQHLGVLEEANLVLIRREGKNRFNYSNPSVLKDLYDEWINPLSSNAADAAQHLRRYVENQQKESKRMNDAPYRQVKIELESHILAPRQIVYDALTVNYAKWWPHRSRPDAELYFDNVIGGTLGERWPGGGGWVYGNICMLLPGEKVMTCGIGMMGDYTATNLESLCSQEDGSTIYRKKLHLWGDVPEDLERMFREGSQSIVNEALKSYCERNIS